MPTEAIVETSDRYRLWSQPNKALQLTARQHASKVVSYFAA